MQSATEQTDPLNIKFYHDGTEFGQEKGLIDVQDFQVWGAAGILAEATAAVTSHEFVQRRFLPGQTPRVALKVDGVPLTFRHLKPAFQSGILNLDVAIIDASVTPSHGASSEIARSILGTQAPIGGTAGSYERYGGSLHKQTTLVTSNSVGEGTGTGSVDAVQKKLLFKATGVTFDTGGVSGGVSVSTLSGDDSLLTGVSQKKRGHAISEQPMLITIAYLGFSYIKESLSQATGTDDKKLYVNFKYFPGQQNLFESQINSDTFVAMLPRIMGEGHDAKVLKKDLKRLATHAPTLRDGYAKVGKPRYRELIQGALEVLKAALTDNKTRALGSSRFWKGAMMESASADAYLKDKIASSLLWYTASKNDLKRKVDDVPTLASPALCLPSPTTVAKEVSQKATMAAEKLMPFLQPAVAQGATVAQEKATPGRGRGRGRGGGRGRGANNDATQEKATSRRGRGRGKGGGRGRGAHDDKSSKLSGLGLASTSSESDTEGNDDVIVSEWTNNYIVGGESKGPHIFLCYHPIDDTPNDGWYPLYDKNGAHTYPDISIAALKKDRVPHVKFT